MDPNDQQEEPNNVNPDNRQNLQPPDQLDPSSNATSPLNTQSPPAKRKPLKLFLIIFVLLVIAGIGAFIWHNNKPKTKTQAVNKDIAHLSVGLGDITYGKMYPNINFSASDYLVNSQIFEGLVVYKDRSNIVPLLAVNWSNPDDNTWVFDLKQDINFHNGHHLTAKDVVYSIEKIKKDNPNLEEFTSTIKTVEQLGDYQVKITTDGPDPVLLNRLASLFIIDHQADPQADPSQAGTGPYVVKQGVEPTATNVELTAVNNYHGGHVYVGAIQFGAEKSEDELLKAYQSGKYDIAGDFSSKSVSKLVNPNIFIQHDASVSFIGMNGTNGGPLAIKEVRQAVRYAADPLAIATSLGYKGQTESQVVPEEIPGHNPNITQYPHDPAKAKQLLAKAGYPKGLTLEFAYGFTDDNFAGEVSREFKEAGINLKIVKLDNIDQLIPKLNDKAGQLYYLTYSSDTLDGVDTFSTILEGTSVYKDSSIPGLISEASKEIDPSKRLKTLQEISKMSDDDVATAPLFSRNLLWAMNKNYEVTQDHPSESLGVNLYKVHER